jgi:hypothetical protein
MTRPSIAELHALEVVEQPQRFHIDRPLSENETLPLCVVYSNGLST